MKELFLVQKQENKLGNNLGQKIFQVINLINELLEEGNYSSNELYQMLIYKGYLAPTKQKEFGKIIRLGLREGLIDKNKLYSKDIKEKKLPNFFNKEELVKFFSNMVDVRTAVACFIALNSGLRISEVIKLRIDDIDYNNETIKIVQSKGSKDRYAPFLKEGHNVLKKWIEYTGYEEYLFESHRARSMATINEPYVSYITIHDGFNGTLKKAGLDKEDERYKNGRKKKTFHSLRHTFATYHLGKGVSPVIIKKALGHVKMDTTVNVYGHINDPTMIESLRGEKIDKEISNEVSSTEYLNRIFIEGRISEEEYKKKKEVLMG